MVRSFWKISLSSSREIWHETRCKTLSNLHKAIWPPCCAVQRNNQHLVSTKTSFLACSSYVNCHVTPHHQTSMLLICLSSEVWIEVVCFQRTNNWYFEIFWKNKQNVLILIKGHGFFHWFESISALSQKCITNLSATFMVIYHQL